MFLLSWQMEFVFPEFDATVDPLDEMDPQSRAGSLIAPSFGGALPVASRRRTGGPVSEGRVLPVGAGGFAFTALACACWDSDLLALRGFNRWAWEGGARQKC